MRLINLSRISNELSEKLDVSSANLRESGSCFELFCYKSQKSERYLIPSFEIYNSPSDDHIVKAIVERLSPAPIVKRVVKPIGGSNV